MLALAAGSILPRLYQTAYVVASVVISSFYKSISFLAAAALVHICANEKCAILQYAVAQP